MEDNELKRKPSFKRAIWLWLFIAPIIVCGGLGFWLSSLEGFYPSSEVVASDLRTSANTISYERTSATRDSPGKAIRWFNDNGWSIHPHEQQQKRESCLGELICLGRVVTVRKDFDNPTRIYEMVYIKR